MPLADAPEATPRCNVCAQPSKKLKCSKCKTPYCSVACQVLDWKSRGHKAICKRLVKEAAERGEAPTPPPSPKPKAVPPVVEGPARRFIDVARARARAAAATAKAAAPAAPEPEHWLGSSRCPICLEDWDVNKVTLIRICCCNFVCNTCDEKWGGVNAPCPICKSLLPESEEEGLAMLRRRVENENPKAVCHLGLCYMDGRLGLKPSDKKAARLYERAVELGNVAAMYFLGCIYQFGRGVKPDKKKSFEYWRMAADRGHAVAQFNLGCCFNEGEGVAKDYAEAFRFYKLAADKGYTDAECNLGCAYVLGEGVARDDAEAYRWFERAAAKGNEKAKAAAARLRTSFPTEMTNLNQKNLR